ncbi:cytochrome c oxidase assembly protein [Pararhizobium sp. IMCC21322]|uniref:cytochrome c oxidase assembly protein n=1 Tax=Pararhizobium sp. IMCC21322 TaxID=3067903 RepID=UPI002740C619|nr:cytochrome c oxidase assembly protein [Pararhizobium sp. IMCC21322]
MQSMQAEQAEEKRQKRQRLTAAACVVFLSAMIGMSYAAVPLYELFCKVTGYGGTTQVAEAESDRVIDRQITIRFDANIAAGLPWKFKPTERQMVLQVGETGHAAYGFSNLAETRTIGTSTFNVTPQSAGAYFNKLECFCFTEQVLAAGESVEMPVVFFIDPAIADDPELDSVRTITLSYTFFPVEGGVEPVANLDKDTKDEIPEKL